MRAISCCAIFTACSADADAVLFVPVAPVVLLGRLLLGSSSTKGDTEMVTHAQIDFYRTFGFAVLPELIELETVAALSD
jgi:hypothetical protein